MIRDAWHWLWHQVRPVAYKEVIHIFNDPATLRMAVMLPLIQLVIFGFAINMEVKDISTVVYNEDQRLGSIQLIDRLVNTTYFKVKKTVYSRDAVLEAIRQGTANVGIIIPPDYQDNLETGRPARFQVLIDGSQSNTATQAMATVTELGTIMSQEQQAKLNAGSIQPVIQIQAQPFMLYNPDLKTTFLTIPGLLGIVLLNVTLLLTTFSIVREREHGTMDQLLVTPLKPSGLMVGKILPYTILGLLDFNLVVAAMVFMFGIPIQGNILLLEFAALLFLTSVLGLGLLISARTTTQTQAGQVAQLMILPGIMLSGFVFPIEAMPVPIQWISHWIPMTYFIEILRGIILRGASMQELAVPMIKLLGLGSLVLGASIVTFRRRLS